MIEDSGRFIFEVAFATLIIYSLRIFANKNV